MTNKNLQNQCKDYIIINHYELKSLVINNSIVFRKSTNLSKDKMTTFAPFQASNVLEGNSLDLQSDASKEAMDSFKCFDRFQDTSNTYYRRKIVDYFKLKFTVNHTRKNIYSKERYDLDVLLKYRNLIYILH